MSTMSSLCILLNQNPHKTFLFIFLQNCTDIDPLQKQFFQFFCRTCRARKLLCKKLIISNVFHIVSLSILYIIFHIIDRFYSSLCTRKEIKVLSQSDEAYSEWTYQLKSVSEAVNCRIDFKHCSLHRTMAKIR